MVKAGASAYLLKDNLFDELLKAIQVAVQGQSYLCPEVATVVLRACQEDHSSLSNLNDHEIEQDISESIHIESDRGKLDQVLQNLISNAVKFTEHGKVAISARLDEGNVYIEVTDTGIGIPENELPYIFDEFRQVDGSTSRHFEGTGQIKKNPIVQGNPMISFNRSTAQPLHPTHHAFIIACESPVAGVA